MKRKKSDLNKSKWNCLDIPDHKIAIDPNEFAKAVNKRILHELFSTGMITQETLLEYL